MNASMTRDGSHANWGRDDHPGRITTARSRLFACVLGLGAAALVGGCGVVSVDPAAGGDFDGFGVDSLTDGGIIDAIGTDSALVDTAEPQCITNFDCDGVIPGQSICRLPACVAGQCELENRDIGTPCIHPSDQTEACEVAACDEEGACSIRPQSDGSPCGLGACGQICALGLCVAASATDYDDGNPCTDDYCEQGQQVVHAPITDLGLGCDDGDVCTQSDVCISGSCKGEKQTCSDGVACTLDTCDADKGCIHTANDEACTDDDPCTIEACDEAKGCEVAGYDAGAKCDDGSECTNDETCTKDGACVGASTCPCEADNDCEGGDLCVPQICKESLCEFDLAAAVACDSADDSECLKNLCQPDSGQCQPTPVAGGKSCDDGSACTTTSTCDTGECGGEADVDCDDANPCTNDLCTPVEGCMHLGNALPCDDGNPCTSDDACAKGGCTGTPAACDDDIACTFDSCDPGTGACANTPGGGACDDANPCTSDACEPGVGCAHEADNAASCDDGDDCTDDACQGGQCVVASYVCQCKNDADCDDKNPCTVDTCSAGSCSTEAGNEGSACSTGSKCDLPDSGTCKAGACTGGATKTCADKKDACNDAQCNPATGACEVQAKKDGTACDADGDGCTANDGCKAGECAAGAAPDCSEKSDACHTGACKDGTGDDGTAYSCVGAPVAKGTACNDGQFCTIEDTCDGEGACMGGLDKTCSEYGNACNSGYCDEEGDACATEQKAPSTVCDDGEWCTQGDHCSEGECVGDMMKACPGGLCQVGVCDDGKDACTLAPAPAGTPCDDGKACTEGDLCNGEAGCSGQEKVCDDDNLCTDDACSTNSGACTTAANSAPCNDGDACTSGDICAGGACTGPKITNCADEDKCTADACSQKTGACSHTPIPGCGGNCVSDGNCATTNACLIAFCDMQVGKCATKEKADGTKCSDGDLCTGQGGTDSCKAGTCVGKATYCNDNNLCTSDSCAAATGACVYANNTLACSDGNPCTGAGNTDTCSGGSCKGAAVTCNDNNACTSDTCLAFKGMALCSNTPKVCKSDGNVCTNDVCNPKTGACSYPNNTAACTHADACVIGEKCSLGKCVGVQNPCIDGKACTKDACYKGICSHTVDCDDGLAYTLDYCDPGTGKCVHKFCIKCLPQ